MIAWGTEIDRQVALGWVAQFLGEQSEQFPRLAAILATR